MIAFNRNLPSTWRKEYRGNAAANIAVMNVRDGSIQEITNTDLQQFRGFANNVFPMWGADGMIYFASERDGTFNLWRMSAKGGAAQQVTSLKGGGVFFPSISPRKSVEGAVAGAVAAVLVGTLAGPWLIGMSVPLGAGLGALIAIASQGGDLVESAIKRAAGVKDSGTLIPGHGGLLDRADAIVLLAPVVYCYLKLIAFP